MLSRTAAFALIALAGCSFQEQKAVGATPNLTQQGVPSFAAIESGILQPKCLRCHSAAHASGHVDLSSYAAILANPGLVVSGQPGSSRLYTEVQTGDMPEGGPALDPTEVQAIEAWIVAGAPEGQKQ